MKQGAIGERPYEDAAEQVTLTGWACKHCHRFYGPHDTHDKHAAQWCCASDKPCGEDGCTNRAGAHYTVCDACLTKREDAKWFARERRPWDGVQMVYSETTDRYYSSPDEALEEAEDRGEDLDTMRLVLCEPNSGRTFEMAEHLSDDLPSDDPDSVDTRDIDAIVNKWIDDHAPFSWEPGKFAWNGETAKGPRT